MSEKYNTGACYNMQRAEGPDTGAKVEYVCVDLTDVLREAMYDDDPVVTLNELMGMPPFDWNRDGGAGAA